MSDFLEVFLGILTTLAGVVILVMVLVRIYRIRLRRRMIIALHVDPLEAEEKFRWGRYKAFLVHKYREQDMLVRRRVMQFLDSLTSCPERELRAHVERARRIANEKCVSCCGTVKKRRKLSSLFPFVKVVDIRTELSFYDRRDFSNVVTIPGPPLELVYDLREIEEARIMLGQ